MVKKILSLFILLSLIPTVFAGSVEWLAAANFLASKGVISSHADNPDEYRLADTITRKETMKIVAKLAGVNPEEKCEGKFKDVDKDWGCKYIERALKVGFISAGPTFRPNDNITKAEALKLIFKARGIEKAYDTGNWQADYYNTALKNGLVNGEEDDGNYNADASRGWIFFACANDYDEYEEYTMSDEAM